MQIVDDKIIVLRTRTPDKYQIIPKHRVLSRSESGVYEVAVNFGLEEARVLRNLGVKNVPSPITKRYHWPGKFKPFAHQIETAAFLTMHRRGFCFNDPGCVDSETEYLTPAGWKRIADYAGGTVAQYLPETGAIEFVEPEAFVKRPCEDMLRIKTKYGVDQLLSPEHRVLLHSTADHDKRRVMSAAAVFAEHNRRHSGEPRLNQRKAGSDTLAFDNMAIPAAFEWAGGTGCGLTVPELRLQIAVIADGHFPNSNQRCVVRLKRARKIARLRTLLADAGVSYREKEDSSATGRGFFVFSFDAPLRLKHYDERFWQATAQELGVVRDEIMHWDGSIRPGNKGAQFFSTDKRSADFVQFAFSSAGRVARITEDIREGRSTCYTVTVRALDSKYLSLRNRNAPTMAPEPSTDGFKYCFTVPSTFLVFRRNGCVFASGNTGKTLSCLWAADYLMSLGFVRRVLIICPLSIMESAWMKDIYQSIIHRTAAIAYHASADTRKEIVRRKYDFIIANYDGLPMIADEIKKDGTFDLIIADEASHYKNPNTRRWKTLASVVKPNTYLWMLTGTPASQSPLDAYGLAKLVNPDAVPRFWSSWRDEVMIKASMFKWVPRDTAKDSVHRVLQPAVRFTKAQCLDLPPVLFETRQVPLTPQQTKYYEQVKRHAVMQAAGETVTAVNAATVVSKLLQISAGATYTDDHEIIEFDCKPRLAALDEVMEQTDRKVIVFAPFRHSIATVVDHLKKKGISCAEIHGDVNATKRGEIFHRFQTKPDPRVLVIQPQAAAHGVTLTAADTVIFWGPVMSVETWLQCIARADRIGQQGESVTVVRLQASEVEKRMYTQLENRIADHIGIVKLYEEELNV